jgi:drug/metabolite transporter superfamily protein YnfA
MSSVSLTVPFIPDLVKFNKRGLAYAYLGLLFTMALLIFFLIIELEVHEILEERWLFVCVGGTGVVADLMFCWGFSDSYK